MHCLLCVRVCLCVLIIWDQVRLLKWSGAASHGFSSTSLNTYSPSKPRAATALNLIQDRQSKHWLLVLSLCASRDYSSPSDYRQWCLQFLIPDIGLPTIVSGRSYVTLDYRLSCLAGCMLRRVIGWRTRLAVHYAVLHSVVCSWPSDPFPDIIRCSVGYQPPCLNPDLRVCTPNLIMKVMSAWTESFGVWVVLCIPTFV